MTRQNVHPKVCQNMPSLVVHESLSFPQKAQSIVFLVIQPKMCALNRFNGYMALFTYIYICILWSYYLGHVWGLLMVTNWATFVFLKTLFVKKTL